MTSPSARYPDLAGKHVLVTGGAAGIGAAVVEAFVEQGSSVSFIDRDEAAGMALAARLGGQARFFPADLTDDARLQAVLAAAHDDGGPVRVLVNNAAWDPRYALTEMSPAEWDGLFKLNVGHAFITSRAALPGMISVGGGSIIMVSSIQTWLGEAHLACYTATKAALVGMVRSLASEVGRHNVRVNAIAPGWVMTERQLREHATPAAQRKLLEEQQALPFLLQPRDVAPAFLFLASDAARAITRQTLIVDGGRI